MDSHDRSAAKAVPSAPGLGVPATCARAPEFDFEQRLYTLRNLLLDTTKRNLTEDGKKTLTILTTQLQYIAKAENPYVLAEAEISAASLSSEESPPEVALELAKGVRRRLRPYSFFPSQPLATMAGLLLCVPFILVLMSVPRLLLYLPIIPIETINELLGVTFYELFMVAAAGAIGSIVSILIRCQVTVFEPKRWQPTSFFLTGFGKPLVGAAFALFIFACLKSDIVTVGRITGDEENFRFLSLALGFVAGFSERFATDVITKVADTSKPNDKVSYDAEANKQSS